MTDILYGRNVARECLRARRRHVHRVLMAEKMEKATVIQEITTLAREKNIPIQYTKKQELDKITRDHQGVALQVGNYPTVAFDDILKRAEKLDQPPFVVVLDHIEDPHNLGAIIRTAEQVGVHGVVIPKQRSASVTATVVKASAGAVEHMWVTQVGNLSQTLKRFKERDGWVAGVEDRPGATLYSQANLKGAMALVIGNEGRGLSRLVRETCDFLIKLPMQGEIDSLNASVAAGLALYEVWRQRDFVGAPGVVS